MSEWVMHESHCFLSVREFILNSSRRKKKKVNKNRSLNIILITRTHQQLLHSYRDEQEDTDLLFKV